MNATISHDPRGEMRRLNRLGLAAVAVLVLGVGGWASTSQMSGAVIAPGTIVVESSVKKIQHATGGIVSQILVKDGSVVEEGQVLVRLDDTLTRATLGIVQAQLEQLLAREARLLAERDGADSLTDPEFFVGRKPDSSAAAALTGEQKLFESRRQARLGQRAQLRERITQILQEIEGLSRQQEAKEREIKFVAEELAGVTELYRKNLIPIVRLMALQRDEARLQGDRGQYIADIARARGKISEIELQVIQLDQDFRTDVLRDLRETQAKIVELRERYAAAEDQLRRVEIRAPQAGIVHQLAAHTIGGFVASGEIIMQIVPRQDVLVIEARVGPQDVDQVAPGATAVVRLLAGNQRTAPDLSGALTTVSPDLAQDQRTGLSYYRVRIELGEEETRRLGDLKLVPGMPVEAFIKTQERTPLEYLLKPLKEQIDRSFRER